MKNLPKAQRRVLHRVAKATNKGFLWWKCAFLHDFDIFHKLVRRGYAAEEWHHHKSGGKMLVQFLTPKGWAASGIKPRTEMRP